MKFKPWLLVLLVLFWAGLTLGQPLSGAIFTTLPDGSAVNHNIYDKKEDVYLDGGPGQNAPISAAGLPEGYYYFQVTDPSGKHLLSEDAVKCRCFYVNEYGVIDGVCEATVLEKVKGKMTEVSCSHNTGYDIDHGAVTVQLYPYSKTPNPGGVYKVWATPVECFDGDPEQIDNPGRFHGFIPSCSKTDNFKVKKGKPCDPPVIEIVKIDDSNANGIKDETEEEIIGWPMIVTDPLGVETLVYTPATILAAPAGLWTICEATDDDWKVIGSECQEIQVAETCDGTTYEVVFYNIQLGEITACKGYDLNADGIDDGIPVEGFAICIEGIDVTGSVVSDCKYTDSTGCVTFEDLLPGEYTLCEILPDGWHASYPDCVSVSLEENEDATVQFLNFCKGKMNPHTKGFWQNQGCDIVNEDDLDYLATLPPFMSGKIITKGQDNCGGEACPSWVTLPLTTTNELGCYIVAPNSQDPGIGLAQQLMAFVLNCRHGSGLNATLILDNIGLTNVQDIITAAIDAWQTGQDVTFWQNVLDEINNMDYVYFVAVEPCPITY